MTSSSRGRKPGVGSFANQVSFHFRKGGHHGEEAVGRGGCVDGVCNATKMNTSGLKQFHQFKQAFHCPTQPVQLPHVQGVTLTQVGKRFRQASRIVLGFMTGRPLCSRSR